MNLRLSNRFINVHDDDYRDVLGLDVRSDVRFEAMRRVGVGPTSQPDIHIVLEPPADQPCGIRDCAFHDPAGSRARINRFP